MKRLSRDYKSLCDLEAACVEARRIHLEAQKAVSQASKLVNQTKNALAKARKDLSGHCWSKESIRERAAIKVWRTNWGILIPYTKMSNSHLLNAIDKAQEHDKKHPALRGLKLEAKRRGCKRC